jgi:quercetin dioxygenase-like cupin family protein
MRWALRSAVLALAAACSSPAPAPVTPQPPLSHSVPVGAPVVDAAPPGEDEKLAAIQKAMNELDEATQQCWAAAAVERFDIEGELTARIDVGDGTMATLVGLVQDTANSPRLASCVIAVLTDYPWAPPLRGQTIQIPFKFRAPDGQNVIDRALVPWNGQGNTSVAVLLDDANTGNDAASMVALAIASGGSTGLRRADRTELWYFLGPATVSSMGAKGATPVTAGDMMYMPKGGARDVKATAGDVHAVIVLLPGGREGTARAGALPTPEVTSWRSALAGPTILPASKATTHGPATIYAEPAITKDSTFAASVLRLAANATVPEHVHAGETELLYVLEGSGTMTIAGVSLPVTPTSAIQIPPNTKHAFTATTNVRAVQVYTPAGPEQRFKAAKKATP